MGYEQYLCCRAKDQQLANGAMQGTTADGTTIVNSTTGTSKLPMDLNFGRAMSSSAQRLARESQVQAETSLQGFNHAMNSAYNQAQQFSQQTGNSNTMNTSTDDSQTAQATRGVSSMISAAKDYAKRHGISEQQAWAEIETKSRDAELEGHGGWSLSKSALGKAATAMGFDAGVSGKVSAKSGSQSSADQRQSGSTDHSSSEDAKNVRDFREGKQILQSYRVSHSAVRNDNSSASQLEQIGTTLSVADSQYQQYTSSVSRSHEYSKVASMSESETAQQTSNLSQEFVGYVQQKAPGMPAVFLLIPLMKMCVTNAKHWQIALWKKSCGRGLRVTSTAIAPHWRTVCRTLSHQMETLPELLIQASRRSNAGRNPQALKGI